MVSVSDIIGLIIDAAAYPLIITSERALLCGRFTHKNQETH